MTKDPYKYFRVEAVELVENMSQGILDLEKSGPSKELVSKLLRYAHTLKGAARVVKQVEISQSSHSIEDILAPYREGSEPVQKKSVQEVLKLLDSIHALIKNLGSSEAAPIQTSNKEPAALKHISKKEETFESIRIDISEMDEVLEGLTNNTAHLQAMRSYAPLFKNSLQLITSLLPKIERLDTSFQDLPKAEELQRLLSEGNRNYTSSLERAQRSLEMAREKAASLRLLPAESIFASLQRSVRDAAESTQKSIVFESSGGDTQLDTHVLRALKNALLHVVRNAVAHGIETQAERKAFGKDPTGHIHLHVERRGSQIAFICRDDGKGIHLDEIKNVLLKRGKISQEEANHLELEKALSLILKGGISTTHKPDELSGRGVGLDVLNTTINNLKGNLKIQSIPSKGTTVDICVPISIESLKILSVTVGNTQVSLPFDSVRQAFRVTHEQIAHNIDGDSLVFEGKALPMVSLTKMFKPDLVRPPQNAMTVLILSEGASSIALVVDSITNVEEVVIRPLPTNLGNVPLIHGVFFDTEGNPQLILEAQSLVQTGSQIKEQENYFKPKENRILVIDDSLTTRMLEQTVLESAGYNVDLATSGEEALETAHKNDYTLFIVDVEMPGINGFEFIQLAKADPKLKHIPAILVTSLADAEHRKRGKEAGASAHIMKSEFDERIFLNTIRQLIG